MNLPPQIMVEDETAYRLALTIQNYLFYTARFTEPFQDISEMAGLLEAAIYHTSPLNLRFSYGVGKGFVCEEYPNHVITKLAQELVLEGKHPSEFFYTADVRTTAKILFGEAVEYEDRSTEFYEYFPQQGVYVLFGDLAGPRFPYPQITAYSETESGYQCDAILAYALDKDIPIEIDGQILTKDTFDSLTATKPKYRYTFATQPDGRLVTTSLQILN